MTTDKCLATLDDNQLASATGGCKHHHCRQNNQNVFNFYGPPSPPPMAAPAGDSISTNVSISGY